MLPGAAATRTECTVPTESIVPQLMRACESLQLRITQREKDLIISLMIFPEPNVKLTLSRTFIYMRFLLVTLNRSNQNSQWK
jgi:hypothetical protein